MSSGPPSPPAFTPGKVLVGAAFTVGALIAGAAWSRRSRWGLALGVGIAVVSGRKFVRQLREDSVATGAGVDPVPPPAPVLIAEPPVEKTVAPLAALPSLCEPEAPPEVEVLAPSPDYQRSGAAPAPASIAPAPEAAAIVAAPASLLPLAESLLPPPPSAPAFPPAPSAPAPVFSPQPLFQEAGPAPAAPETPAPSVAAFLAQEALAPSLTQPVAWDAAQHPHAPLIWESRDTGSRSSEGPGETVWFGLHEVTLETLLPSTAPAPSTPSHPQGEVALEADMDAPVAVGLDMAALIQALNPPSLGSTVMGEDGYTGLEAPSGIQENHEPAPDSFLLDPEPATTGISQKL